MNLTNDPRTPWMERNFQKAKELQAGGEYPMGGYAPGGYMCECHNCGIQFFGDKRAISCEPCGVQEVLHSFFYEELLDWAIKKLNAPDITGRDLLNMYRKEIFEKVMGKLKPSST